MAKKIKFALKMKDGVEVRSLQELQDNFDLNQATSYFLEGRLETWLSDRYYDEAAEQIKSLQKEDPELQQKLCQILGVKYEADSMTPEEIEARNRKLAKLKEITDDEEILANVDQVAFSQEELSDLLDEGVDTIYLCGENFVIPERITGKTYIGIQTKLDISREKRNAYEKNGIQLINLIEKEEHNSPLTEIQGKLETLKNLGRGNMDDYRSVANFVLDVIDKLHVKYPDMSLEGKQMFTKLLIATVQAFQLGKHLKMFIGGMIDNHQYAHMLNYVGESTAAMEFREYGADDTEEYYPFMARDVIAYMIMTVADDNMPTTDMYRMIDRKRVSRLVSFKYLNIRVMDQKMVESLSANCEMESLIGAIITTLHNYGNIENLIDVVTSEEVGDPINVFVRRQVIGI